MAIGQDTLRRIEVLEQQVEKLRQYHRDERRRDAVQFVVSLITITVLLLGSAGLLSWQNMRLVDELGRRMDDRFTAQDQRMDQLGQRMEGMEKRLNQRMDERFAAQDQRMDQLEKNLLARFEDLRQVVLAQQSEGP